MFQNIILLLPLTVIIKPAGAVDSTTLPTTPEKSVVKVRFCYVNMFICFHIFSTNIEFIQMLAPLIEPSRS